MLYIEQRSTNRAFIAFIAAKALEHMIIDVKYILINIHTLYKFAAVNNN